MMKTEDVLMCGLFVMCAAVVLVAVAILVTAPAAPVALAHGASVAAHVHG